MDGYGIQVSIKTTNDTMINVRGDDPTEFDMNLSHAVEKIDEIRAAEAAFKSIAATQPADAVTMLETTLGAVKVDEYTTPPAQPATVSTYAQTHCDRCKTSPVCPTCNRPCNIVPLSLKGGQYWKHECPSGSRDHKTVWCNLPK